MTLQAKLTLGSVVLASLMVGVVSAVDLANEMQRQFESTLERAQTLKGVVTKMVSQSLNRQRSVSLREALRDPDLQDLLVSTMIAHSAMSSAAPRRGKWRPGCFRGAIIVAPGKWGCAAPPRRA